MDLDADVVTQLLQRSEDEIKALACHCLTHNLRLVFDRGVCCFSECNDNMLMWGHYAECHRGFCLEFTTNFEHFCDPEKLRFVTYCAKFPHLDVAWIAKGDFEHLLDFLLSKADFWEYERELRLLHKEKCKQFGYERRCLTAVYLGARMSEDLMHLICHSLEKMSTKLFRARIKEGEFSLEFEAVDFKSIDYRSGITTA